MEQRLDYQTASPAAFKAMLQLEQQVRQSGLETALLELVKSRASQLNGCAWCLDMHSKDARALGETEQRLYCCPSGVMPPVTRRANGQHWPGPRP